MGGDLSTDPAHSFLPDPIKIWMGCPAHFLLVESSTGTLNYEFTTGYNFTDNSFIPVSTDEVPIPATMSMIPIGNRGGGNNSDFWLDPFADFPFSLDFPFPSSFSHFFPELGLATGTSVNTRLDWRETSNAHVLRAVIRGEDVLIELQDDRVLQISTESGSFMSRFKLPENAEIQQLNAFMENGVLTITVPKEERARSNNRRLIEISGE